MQLIDNLILVGTIGKLRSFFFQGYNEKCVKQNKVCIQEYLKEKEEETSTTPDFGPVRPFLPTRP